VSEERVLKSQEGSSSPQSAGTSGPRTVEATPVWEVEAAEGFRETLLAEFPHEDASALRRIGMLLQEHALDPPGRREYDGDELLPKPHKEFRAIARDLLFLEYYLNGLAQGLAETGGSQRFQRCALKRARKLGRMAAKFEEEVTEIARSTPRSDAAD
jgi:hypothetical protein